MKAWLQTADDFKEESLGLYLAMKNNKPVLKDKNHYLLKVDNAIQDDLFREKKPEILSKLRKALANYTIDISTKLNTNSKAKKAYLPAEKLSKLMKKNPAIEKLKNTFGLDLDY